VCVCVCVCLKNSNSNPLNPLFFFFLLLVHYCFSRYSLPVENFLQKFCKLTTVNTHVLIKPVKPFNVKSTTVQNVVFNMAYLTVIHLRHSVCGVINGLQTDIVWVYVCSVIMSFECNPSLGWHFVLKCAQVGVN